MPIFFHVDYKGLATLGLERGASKRMHDLALKFAMYNVAVWWYRGVLPRHFQKDAREKYQHQKRKRPYSSIKRKLAAGQPIWNPNTKTMERINVVMGGQVDIAFRGDTVTKAKSNHSITVNRYGFRLKIRVPRYIVMRRFGNYPNMKREISTITPQEARVMSQLFVRYYFEFLKLRPVQQQQRIG